MSRRPASNVPSKYEHPLLPCTEDFFVYFNQLQEDGSLQEAWQEELVEEIRSSLIELIADFMKKSNRARKLFTAMNKETVWEDEEALVIKLTRRNVGTFDKTHLNIIDDSIKTIVMKHINPIREELLGIVSSVNASEEEIAAVEEFCSGDTFFFEDLAQHLVEQEAWRAELFQRMPVIQYLRAREKCILQIIKFEEASHNSSADRKSSISAMNYGKKFKILAGKTLQECAPIARKLVDDYQKQYQKAFEIKGIVYQHKLDEQEAAKGNVPTNFSGLHRDLLVFVDFTNDTIEAPPVSPAVMGLLEGDKYESHEFKNYLDGLEPPAN